MMTNEIIHESEVKPLNYAEVECPTKLPPALGDVAFPTLADMSAAMRLAIQVMRKVGFSLDDVRKSIPRRE